MQAFLSSDASRPHARPAPAAGLNHAAELELHADLAKRSLLGARDRGCDVEGILRRAGIEPAAIEFSQGRISLGSYGRLVRCLRRATRDELWGLCSSPVPLGRFAAACWAAARCSNLHEVLNVCLPHYRRCLSDFRPRLQVRDGLATVMLDRRAAHSSPSSQLAEGLFVFASIKLLQWLIGGRLVGLRIHLTGPETLQGSDVRRAFRAECQYGSEYSSFSFDARVLARPVVRTSACLAAFTRDLPAALFRDHTPSASLADEARRALQRAMRSGVPSSRRLASSLNMSERTLHRRLRTEGLSFQRLKDDVRRDMASGLLRHSGLSLEAISQRVGFSCEAAFSRAFKAWTGESPGAFRRREGMANSAKD